MISLEKSANEYVFYFFTYDLTHWGLVTPYGDLRSSDIHRRASSQEMPQPSITEIIWKIKYLKFHSNFPGANELKDFMRS